MQIQRTTPISIVTPIAILCAIAFSADVGLASAPESEVTKAPEWISLSKTAKAREPIYLRRSFTLDANPRSARLTVACDQSVAVFVNGGHIVQHDHWQLPLTEDITSKLSAGENVVALRCNSTTGSAALLARLAIETVDGAKQTIQSDTSWFATAEPKGNWRLVEYDTRDWRNAVSLGGYGAQPWGEVPLDNAAVATDADAIMVLEGFHVERLYSVPKSVQGSWVGMTPDESGRLITSDQYGGLFRITPGDNAAATKVEKLDIEIGQAQGLLWTRGSLYVVVNDAAARDSGLYRLRDTDGDDQFDEVKLLKRLDGAGEHGPHGIVLGADGKLYIVAGNQTKIPAGCEPTSPHRNWAEDLLLPRNPDGRGHSTGALAPGGWIARTDRDGSQWELFCAGLRNAYDLAFNQQGELFTFDSDMEWDTGTPWYRPTRVNHCVSAGEFGWRYGTGKWPAHYPDSVGAVVDIGMGSPTGIVFGTGAKFPARYQRALFINDWTFGKIYAVHMEPKGSSYTATFETFLEGRPLPVTDVVINRDGAMYFTMGGRRTQSGLYRVTYTGRESTAKTGPVPDAAAARARQRRRQLESFHGRRDPNALDVAWSQLNSSDRRLRYAARIAIEHQAPARWRERALAEQRTNARIQALLALARVGGKESQATVIDRLNQLPLSRMTEEQLLDSLRVYSLAFIRLGGQTPTLAERVIARVDSLYPHPSELVNRELCRLLVYLESPGVIERTVQLLKAAQTQQDQLFYIFVLRNLRSGWTAEQRRAYFSWLNLAESRYLGGASFRRFVQQIRTDAVLTLSEEQKRELKDVIEGRRQVEAVTLETTRQFVHNWQISDLQPLLAGVDRGRSFEKGRAAYKAAQCYKCHRFQGEGGDTGPDITGVGSRFSPLYLLESLIVPSKAVSDQYRNSIVHTDNGKLIIGRVVSQDSKRLMIRTDPFARQLTEVSVDSIEQHLPSKVSEMPQGLVNVLTQDEILDLIAYMRSAGKPQDRAFQSE